MKNKNTIILTAALVASFTLLGLVLISSNNDQVVAPNTVVETSENECISDECLQVKGLEHPVSSLPAEVVESLNKAIDDEYKARATYAAVISKFGLVRPFAMIIRAEEQHISSLRAVYDKYGVDIPSDPYSNVAVADTLAKNCSIGVQAEIDNATLYRENLLPVASEYPDISSVYIKLMNASQDNHLPAFERCAG